MNNLLSSSFRAVAGETEMSPTDSGGGGPNLNKFYKDVELIKQEMNEMERLYKKLNEANEESKTLHSSGAVKQLRSKMDNDVVQVLKKAKLLKLRLDSLDSSNNSSLQQPGTGPGTSSDRMRTSVLNNLRTNLKQKMEDFQLLRDKITEEYKQTIERRYFTITGENPDEKTLDVLISTGESETFMQKAIQEQGRGNVIDIIAEIQERHDAVMDIERNLMELHQVFMDMAVMVVHQGEELNDIEGNVKRTTSYVENGTRQLIKAKKLQTNTRKWTCYAIILLLIIILVVVLSIRPWK